MRAVRFYRANEPIVDELWRLKIHRDEVLKPMLREASKVAEKATGVLLAETARADEGFRQRDLAIDRFDKAAGDHQNVLARLKTTGEKAAEYFDTAVQRATEINDLQDKVKSHKTCPCDSCKLMRKFPDRGYIQRVVKAVARGDAD